MSQEQLAFALDVSRQAVYKWETGASMPDIDKIKKIASYFNISFDTLLDDNIDISTDVSMHKQEQKTVVVEQVLEERYRPVFVAGRPRPDQADEDVAYFNIKGKRIRIADARKTISEKQRKTIELASKQGYRVMLPLQKQALTYFFVDDARKCCGIISDAAEQFVCPFENFAGISEVSNTHPGAHRITISYYNANGYPMTYTFDVYPYRLFPLYVGAANYTATCKEESIAVSDFVKTIDTYAKAILEAGRRLRLPGEVPPELDMEGYRERNIEARKARGQLIKKYMSTTGLFKKIRNIVLVASGGLIATTAVVLVAILLSLGG